MGTEQIKDNTTGQNEEVSSSRTLTSIAALKALAMLSTSHLLKGDNQKSIALAHNPVFYAWTKYIDLQHYYIWNKVAERRIDFKYIPTSEMIADRLIKALI